MRSAPAAAYRSRKTRCGGCERRCGTRRFKKQSEFPNSHRARSSFGNDRFRDGFRMPAGRDLATGGTGGEGRLIPHFSASSADGIDQLKYYFEKFSIMKIY